MTTLIIIVGIAVGYVLPAVVNWRQTRWLHTYRWYNVDPDLTDVLFMILPIVNIVSAIINRGSIRETDEYQSKINYRKLFGLKAKG